MKNILSIVLLLMLTSTILVAQKTNITGKIINKKTQEPITNAVIKIIDTPNYAVSNEAGIFTINTIENVAIEITHLSFITQKTTLSNDNIITMVEKPISLNEIIIKADPLQDISHSVVVIDKVKKGSQPRNITDLFNDIPGFSIQKRGATATEPSLRAFKYEQMNIKYDGGMKMVHACPNRMDPITAHVIPEEVQKIEVVKGPFTVRFGQNFGGIVNLITNASTPEKLGISGSVQAGYETNGENLVARAEVVYAKEKYDITVNTERRDFGNYTDGKDTETSAGFETNSYSVKAGYSPKKNQRLQLDWRQKFGKNIMHAGLPMDSPKDDSYMAGLDYKITSVSEKIKSISAKGYYSFVDHLMTNGYANDDNTRPNYPMIDARTPVTSNTMGGKFEVGITPSKKLLIYAGFDADIIKRDGNKTVVIKAMNGMPLPTPIIKKIKVWQDATVEDYGIFAEANYRISKKVTATVGARTDFVNSSIKDPSQKFMNLYGGEIDDISDVVIGGNIALKYRKNGLQLEAAFGRGTRTPSMTERYIHRFTIGADGRKYIGNPNLESEINHQLEISIAKKINKVKMGMSVFYSKMNNYITAKLNPNFTSMAMNAVAPRQFVNVDANQYGLDAFLSYKVIENLSFNSNISITEAYNETFHESLAQIAPLSIHLGLKYEKETYWADLRTKFVAAQTHFSPSFNETATPAYRTVDLRLGYKPTKKISLGASIINIFDEAYYNHLNFTIKNAAQNNGERIYEVGRNFSVYAIYNF